MFETAVYNGTQQFGFEEKVSETSLVDSDVRALLCIFVLCSDGMSNDFVFFCCWIWVPNLRRWNQELIVDTCDQREIPAIRGRYLRSEGDTCDQREIPAIRGRYLRSEGDTFVVD
jgi:hypothetical protein